MWSIMWCKAQKQDISHSTPRLHSWLKYVTLFLIVVEKFDEDEIFTYNVGLGALTKFIKAALKHRNSNVELRKAQKETERQKRADIIAENEKI